MMNYQNGVENKKSSADRLSEIANKIRAYTLIAIYNAKSGHPGASLSSIDLITVAYMNNLKYNPNNPNWEERDRFFLSKDHACPALYVALAMVGYYNIDDVMTLRKLNSPFQGHPDMLLLNGIEISGGSLGQILSVAVGSALAGKIKNLNYNVFCLMGDGEHQEGNLWEAVMSASNFGLDNLIGIIDRNHLQIDGNTEEIMSIEPLALKYKSFGWHVIEINGHDINQILKAYEEAIKIKGKPCVIIANTIKGKGISFMENNIDWHSKQLNYEQLVQALNELRENEIPINHLIKIAEDYEKKIKEKFSKNYLYNQYVFDNQNLMKIESESTREAFGRAITDMNNSKILKLSSDSCRSVFKFNYEKFDFNKKTGILNLGIAEQNMTNVAAGLAKEGFIPIIVAYGIFCSGRNWEQLRNTVCVCNLNVKVAGVGGLTIGGDGASHQALEELFLTTCLPNMKVFVPCDSLETKKITQKIIEINGPCYIRLGKSNFPIITKKETPFEVGKANIIRFRNENKNFIDAFDYYLSSDYKSENENLAIIACGLMVSEAMKAAFILKKKYKIETRVINMHTIKPLDENVVKKIAEEIEFAIVVEEHLKGGLGNLISKVMMDVEDKKIKKFKMMGIEDRFAKSGNPDDLIKYFKLDAVNIVDIVVKELKL